MHAYDDLRCGFLISESFIAVLQLMPRIREELKIQLQVRYFFSYIGKLRQKIIRLIRFNPRGELRHPLYLWRSDEKYRCLKKTDTFEICFLEKYLLLIAQYSCSVLSNQSKQKIKCELLGTPVSLHSFHKRRDRLSLAHLHY